MSESSAYKAICWIEDTLISSEIFHLPGRTALLKSDMDDEVILVDASESPIERPKKKQGFTQERKKDTQ